MLYVEGMDMADNVDVSIEDDVLVLRVKLDHRGQFKSGKPSVATSGGWRKVVNLSDTGAQQRMCSFSLNVSP